MPDFSAGTNFDPKKNYTEVKFGADAPLLETELNLLQEIQNDARAEIVRGMVHSGVLDYKPGIYNLGLSIVDASSGFGAMSTAYKPQFTQEISMIAHTSFNAIINGYKILVPNGKIVMPEPPLTGTRDDLVFLEAWFEEIPFAKDSTIKDSRIGQETSRRKKLNWRIRTVAGVDFSKNPRGFKESQGDVSILPQGGLSSPVDLATANANHAYTFRSAPTAWNKFSDDMGLFVAGKGLSGDKTVLNTTDGMVYAIPLLRVKRRNSGGYRDSNLNGAREVYSLPNFATAIKPNQTQVIQKSQMNVGDFEKVEVGDYLYLNSNYNLRVVAKTSDTITGLNTGALDLGGLTKLVLQDGVGMRPDGKFANIIDQDDIVDLRHKVSMNGVNYDRLLQENFDKLLNGQLKTSSNFEDVKEVFGLEPAPKGTPVQLLPTRVKGDDGKTRHLTNLLGDKGKNASMVLTLNGPVTYTTERSWKGYGDNAYKVSLDSSASSGTVYRNVLADKIIAKDKYYLFGVDAKNVNSTSSYIFVDGIGIDQNTSGNRITSTEGFSYLKTSPEYLSNATVLNVHLFVRGLNGVSAMFDGLRIYEIDKETYDKIDVDPEFTGQKLADKFPYVDSYPNVVTNLFDIKKATMDVGIAVSTGLTFASTNLGITDYIPVSPGVELKINQSLYGAFYTSNKTYIEGTQNKEVVVPPANAAFIRYTFAKLTMNTFQIYKNIPGITQPPVPIPFGTWKLPYSYASQSANYRIQDVMGDRQRKTWSDAVSSELVTDIVRVTGGTNHPPHIKVNQANVAQGKWSAGDTIKISSENGVISGAIDTDTALAKVTKIVSAKVVELTDVSKLSVGDKFRVFNYFSNNVWNSEFTVQSIDTTASTVTVDLDFASSTIDLLIVESTASSSTPVFRSENTDGTGSFSLSSTYGTWTGLGTKEATFTFSGTFPTDYVSTKNLSVEYSVSYPPGKGITNLPSETVGAEVNGLKYSKGTTLSLRADFRRKYGTSLDACPHTIKTASLDTLIPPSSGLWNEFNQDAYVKFSSADGDGGSTSTVNVSGRSVQVLITFNIVEEVRRQIGIPSGLTLADEITWVKNNLSLMRIGATTYGESPSGNKAELRLWSVQGNNYPEFNQLTTSNSYARLSLSRLTTDIARYIDEKGNVYAIVYADPTNGVDPSRIYMDYTYLELELNVTETGYDLLVPDEPFDRIVDDPEMYIPGENLIPPFSKWTYLHPNTRNVSDYEIELQADAENIISYTILKLKPGETYTYHGETEVPSSAKPFRVHFYRMNGSLINSDSIGGTFTVPQDAYTTNVRFTNFQTVGKIVKFSRPMLCIGTEKSPFVPNTKDTKRKQTLTFRGKIAGSEFENPHKAYRIGASDFRLPTNSGYALYTEQTAYDALSSYDGNARGFGVSTVGAYAQHMFEFDLNHLGLTPTELRRLIRKISVNWVGFGSGEYSGATGYGATLKIYDYRTLAWATWSGESDHTSGAQASTPVVKSPATPSYHIDNNGKVYVLVNSFNPAGSTASSQIFTDYIGLELTFADQIDVVKKNPVKVRRETKEIKMTYPRYSTSGREDVVGLLYKHLPHQAISVPNTAPFVIPDTTYVLSGGTGVPEATLIGSAPVAFDRKVFRSAIKHVIGELSALKLHDFIPYSLRANPTSPTNAYSYGFRRREALVVNYDDPATNLYEISYSDGIPSWVKRKALNATPALIFYNGELYLKIRYRATDDPVLTPYGLGNVGDTVYFRLEGRPLVKEV
jgi:hypothetical protein